MPLMSKNAFGNKDNIEAAKIAGSIDEYDILYLDNGEVGWINKDKKTIINTPRTQEDIEVTCVESFDEEDGNVIRAGKTIDDVVKLITQKLIPQVKEDITAITSEGVEVVEF